MSNIINENSRFSNLNGIKPDVSFNSPSVPLSSAASASGLTKPRFSKTRRQPSSSNPRGSTSTVTGPEINSSYNPFCLDSSNLNSAPAGNEISGKNMAFEFGVAQSNSNLNFNSRYGDNVDKTVLDGIQILNIGREEGVMNIKTSDFKFNTSSMKNLSANEGLSMNSSVHKSNSKKNLSSIKDEIFDQMKELNIARSYNDEFIGKNKDPNIEFGGNEKVRVGHDNINSSIGVNLKSELPSQFMKLNVKNTPVLNDGETSVAAELPDQMKHLNLRNYVNTNGIKSSMEETKTSEVPKFIFRTHTVTSGSLGIKTENELLDKMGNMNIESVGGDSSIETEIFTEKKKQVFKNDDKSISTTFTFETKGAPYVTMKQDDTKAPYGVFQTPNPKGTLFSNLNQKSVFSAKRGPINNIRPKKGKGPMSRHQTPAQVVWLAPNHAMGENVSQENPVSPVSYSPMDASPYEETLAQNRSRETSVVSDNSLNFDDSNDCRPAVSNDVMDEDLVAAIQTMGISETDENYEVKKEDFTEFHYHKGGASVEVRQEDSIAGVETESFYSAVEELESISDTATSFESEATRSSNTEKQESDRVQFFSTSSQGSDVTNFIFGSSSSSYKDQAPYVARQFRKKNRPKLGTDFPISSPVQFPFSVTTSILSPSHNQIGDTSGLQHRKNNDFATNKEQETKHVSISATVAGVTSQEECEKWRLRGNQAYSNGDFSKAEDYYTRGVNCVSPKETSRSGLRSLVLCYSNRAATRMSLKRMREAVEDCMLAAVIDPCFLKVQLRAANCYLALGEVTEALHYFEKCLQSEADVCVDIKIMEEASEGIQKAQKLSKLMNQSFELTHRRTSVDAENSLSLIAGALIISSHSDKLLEMKAETLFMLRKYEDVIQLCEQSIDIASLNCPRLVGDGQAENSDDSVLSKNLYFKLWRFNMSFKSYFYLGKLEEALDLLKKQDELNFVTERNESKALESSIPVAGIKELLGHKAAGNEAFQQGRHSEAIEHYTAALSCNVESRPFAAICFCNRAAAYKALGQIIDAIADCSLAIALDKNYLKALSRRASLYEMIRDYGQAASDLERYVSFLVKQVEKTNKSGLADSDLLRQAQLKLSEMEGESRKEIPLNMYMILGIEASVSAPEIKKAYRKAALRHHPDKAGQSLARSENGDDGVWKEIAEEVHNDADRLFKMIGEAYAVLSNPTKRARYDLEEERIAMEKRGYGNSTSRASYPEDVPFDRTGTRRYWAHVQKSYPYS